MLVKRSQHKIHQLHVILCGAEGEYVVAVQEDAVVEGAAVILAAHLLACLRVDLAAQSDRHVEYCLHFSGQNLWGYTQPHR